MNTKQSIESILIKYGKNIAKYAALDKGNGVEIIHAAAQALEALAVAEYHRGYDDCLKEHGITLNQSPRVRPSPQENIHIIPGVGVIEDMQDG